MSDDSAFYAALRANPEDEAAIGAAWQVHRSHAADPLHQGCPFCFEQFIDEALDGPHGEPATGKGEGK